MIKLEMNVNFAWIPVLFTLVIVAAYYRTKVRSVLILADFIQDSEFIIKIVLKILSYLEHLRHRVS